MRTTSLEKSQCHYRLTESCSSSDKTKLLLINNEREMNEKRKCNNK